MLRELGVNRVSMGVQSWDDGLACYARAGSLVPSGQEKLRDSTRGRLRQRQPGSYFRRAWTEPRTMAVPVCRRRSRSSPEHVSAYCLTYEEDTEYFKRMSRAEYRPDLSLDADLFEDDHGARWKRRASLTMKFPTMHDPGRECRHNLAYWLGATFSGSVQARFRQLIAIDGRTSATRPHT